MIGKKALFADWEQAWKAPIDPKRIMNRPEQREERHEQLENKVYQLAGQFVKL